MGWYASYFGQVVEGRQGAVGTRLVIGGQPLLLSGWWSIFPLCTLVFSDVISL